MAQETDFGPLLRAWFPGWSDAEYDDVREQLRNLRVEVIRGATLEQLTDAATREQAAAMKGA